MLETIESQAEALYNEMGYILDECNNVRLGDITISQLRQMLLTRLDNNPVLQKDILTSVQALMLLIHQFRFPIIWGFQATDEHYKWIAEQATLYIQLNKKLKEINKKNAEEKDKDKNKSDVIICE